MSENPLYIFGKDEGDYFLIKCVECGSATYNEYLGWDPSVPHFKARCEECGKEFIYKLSGKHWKGLPSSV